VPAPSSKRRSGTLEDGSAGGAAFDLNPPTCVFFAGKGHGLACHRVQHIHILESSSRTRSPAEIHAEQRARAGGRQSESRQDQYSGVADPAFGALPLAP